MKSSWGNASAKGLQSTARGRIRHDSGNLSIHPLRVSIELLEETLADAGDARTVSAVWRYDPVRGGDRGSIFLHGDTYDVEEVATGATPTAVLDGVTAWLKERKHYMSAQPSPYSDKR